MDSAVIQRCALATLCLLFAGCTLCESARRTLSIEPSAFYWKKDKQRSLAVYSSWADAAWHEESQGCPDLAGRPEYAMGFRDGFVDYVYAGGTGQPPPVPPRKLWNVDFRSEEGHQRAEDWFAGYRHGAQVARDGGYRSLATLRSSFFGMEQGAAGYPQDIWQDGVIEAQGGWPTTESLPTPDMAPIPAMNGPESKSEAEQPSEMAPVMQAPTGEPERRTPAIPATATEDAQPEGGGKTPEPKSTSVRFVGAPTIAASPPRALPAATPPPSPIGPKSISDRAPTRPHSTAVRLAAATSTAKPATTEPQPSSIRIHRDSNDLRSPILSGPMPAAFPFAR